MPASLQEGCVAYMASYMLPVLLCIAWLFLLEVTASLDASCSLWSSHRHAAHVCDGDWGKTSPVALQLTCRL